MYKAIKFSSLRFNRSGYGLLFCKLEGFVCLRILAEASASARNTWAGSDDG